MSTNATERRPLSTDNRQISGGTARKRSKVSLSPQQQNSPAGLGRSGGAKSMVISGPKMSLLELKPAPFGSSDTRVILFEMTFEISPGQIGLHLAPTPKGAKVTGIDSSCAFGRYIRVGDLLTDINGVILNNSMFFGIGKDSVRKLTFHSEFSECDTRWGPDGNTAKAYFNAWAEEEKRKKNAAKQKYDASAAGKARRQKYFASTFNSLPLENARTLPLPPLLGPATGGAEWHLRSNRNASTLTTRVGQI